MTRYIFPLGLRRLTAAALLLAAPLSFSGCGTRASSNAARASATPPPAARAQTPPCANIYVDEAMLSKPYAIIGGTVENICGERLENLTVEIELKHRDDGGTERREVAVTSSAGAINHRPFSRVPSSAAKHASESKAGQHSQSIEPSRPTRAAVSLSPIRP